jgi:hypothetical protein
VSADVGRNRGSTEKYAAENVGPETSTELEFITASCWQQQSCTEFDAASSGKDLLQQDFEHALPVGTDSSSFSQHQPVGKTRAMAATNAISFVRTVFITDSTHAEGWRFKNIDPVVVRSHA